MTPRQKQLKKRKQIKEFFQWLALGLLINGAFIGMFLHWLVVGY